MEMMSEQLMTCGFLPSEVFVSHTKLGYRLRMCSAKSIGPRTRCGVLTSMIGAADDDDACTAPDLASV